MVEAVGRAFLPQPRCPICHSPVLSSAPGLASFFGSRSRRRELTWGKGQEE